MFGKSRRDIEATLTQMIKDARTECKHDQYAMVRQIGEWIANDRRFDKVRDKQGFASEAMKSRSNGGHLRIEALLDDSWRS
jgi:hypothetical protein